jgi:polyketide synthase PksN
MYDQLDFLYEQIKEKKISEEDAIKQIKEIQSQQQRNFPPSSCKKEYNAAYSTTSIDSNGLLEKVEYALVQVVSHILKVRSEDIDVDIELNEYGFDQVSWNEFTNKINQEYRLEVALDIVGEHPTIHSFAEYLIAEYQEVFVKRFSVEVLKNPPPIGEKKAIVVVEENLLREKVIKYFKQLLSYVIKLPTHRIEADAPMENYGIDSIMVMQLTNQLEKIFGSLPKTLFFEYQNIQELTGYFLESYRDKLIELLGIEEKTIAITEIPNDNVDMTESVKSSIGIRSRLRFTALRTESQEVKRAKGLDIAIIGVSGRYPGATNIQEFWRNLRDGKECITEIPKDRWDHSLYYDEDKNKVGKTYSKWGGFLDGVDQFDPLFFNISPREAEIMDPQERLFLECVFATLEDAGYTREALRQYKGFGLEGNVGVYVGVMYEEYQLYGAQETIQGRPLALAGNPSSIANRVSYFCNFHGPSMAVDTMCSSSLTAIHLACQSLERGGCELAIAGGVNVSVHPNKYLMLGQGKFVSSKGRCESFGEGGDGYVPGEGVGAVLLKPLARAIADGDHIYGIIKGTTINHGGKTNGYTVPNLNAQSGVIGQAFKESGIDPRTISYVEAHGTGTSLGDPIEVAGLNKAFQEYTADKQFCAIGSAKSNIGHCESAAGIAGITKILLQLKYRQIVPSLHSKVLNPSIDFSNTPFIVQQELGEWKRPVVDGQEYPRRAGISSFGAGGSNAHILIEEYSSDNQKESSITITDQHPIMIVLSAKNEERLKEQVKGLLFSIQEEQFLDTNLADMAYTLQVGREAMDERLAVMVGSINELEEKLKGFIENQNDIEDLYRGQVKRNKEMLAIFAADEDMATTIDAWISKEKFEKLLEVWVKGLSFDWNKLYNNRKPRRISLPTYPFAKERYWVPEIENTAVTSVITASIHPLLHQNTSDFSEQKFSSIFTGQEFFLMNHVVKGQQVLPGVAYLEMIRAAVEEAAGSLEEDKSRIQLKNVVWATPIVVREAPAHVHIGLFPEENGDITYEIYSQPQEIGADPVVHSQGSAAVLQAIKEVKRLEIKTLQAECSQIVLSSSQCYEAFTKMGIVYGPGHQGIEKVYVGSGKVLAKLVLPSSLSATLEQFVLHPSLMDAALQASIGFAKGTDQLKLALPFALQELEIMRNCTPNMWALLCHSEGSKVGDKVQKLDISLCDEQGIICVQMKGFSSRVLENEINTVGPVEQIGMIMLEPVWKVQGATLETTVPDYSQRVVVLCEPNEMIQESILTDMEKVRFLILQSEKKSIEERFNSYAIQVFEEIKSILHNKGKGKVLMQIVVSTQKEQQLFSGLNGLLKTAQLENPKIIGQLIEVEPGEKYEGIIEKLEESSHSPMEKQIRYQNGKRWVGGLNEIDTLQENVKIPWKEGGIYLITGGVGGLGLIFAQEIAGQVESTTLILTGRSSLTAEKQARLKELEELGSRIIYRQVDVTDKQAVTDLIQNIQEEFGNLHGIIHGAGMNRDNFIIRKSKEELQEVLGPKVSGLVNLDEASKEVSLDFFIIFSSIAATIGNIGQADYATANAFMDTYAGYRNHLVGLQERYGQTLSMNWPLWKDGGMHVDEATEKRTEQSTGMISMQTQTGIHALYQGLRLGKNQAVVVEGNLIKMKKSLFSIDNSAVLHPKKEFVTCSPIAKDYTMEEKVISQLNPELIKEKTLYQFKLLLGEIIKLSVSKIDADEPFESYGIDSIMITQMNHKLVGIFGELSQTLFYEYPTLGDLAEYFIEDYLPECIKWIGLKGQVEPSMEMPLSVEVVAEGSLDDKTPVLTSLKARKKLLRGFTEIESSKKAREPIAIIGMSGQYPQARKLSEYWENLKQGKDCITEIPQDRWSLEGFFHPDSQQAVAEGKSYSKWGGFVEGFADFDPLFFNISPREALTMDPQERLFIESCWEVLEDAGYTKEQLITQYNRRIGVFAGVTKTGFNLYGPNLWENGDYIFPHTSFGSVANRISYLLNLHGPSMPIDTMCSSSLTAIHEACEHIYQGECTMSIAGGVNLYLHPSTYRELCMMRMLSTDGQCKSFGQGGNGFVPGEGVGCVLLKRLSQAVADGDHIYALIRGTSINHGGKTNGYTVPNPKAQGEVIHEALSKAGVDARTVSYIEAHGTGTELGDPIEITGLTQAFQKDTHDTGFCSIGSVKSNIGHLEAAAGIAGLTKIILQMKNKQLVPSLHSQKLNPNINFSKTPFVVQQDIIKWKRPIINSEEMPRRAGISSFGAGGVNAHIVVEEYISEKKEIQTIVVNAQNPVIIVLSAKNEERLREQVKQLLLAIEKQSLSDTHLASIAYTLQVGREAMEERLAMIAINIKDLKEKLQDFIEEKGNIPDLYCGQVMRNKEIVGNFSTDGELQEVVEKWIERKKYSKLLDFWTKGLIFDWNKLYSGSKPQRLSLPTYPFAKERYWFEFQPKMKIEEKWQDGLELDKKYTIHDSPIISKDRVVDIVAQLLGMRATEVNVNEAIDQYGFDSILLMQLLQQLQTELDPSLDSIKLGKCETTQDIIDILQPQSKEKVIISHPEHKPTWPQFPEIIRLNQNVYGHPVFWFHGGMGGIEVYQGIAQKSQRPFYGILARGYMTERVPLRGIQAMASYYIHIIQTVQPEGPYDLGGYSLGGNIAYEVTRQLQELGQKVNTIVMLDTIDSNRLNQHKISCKTRALQAVNSVLMSTIYSDLNKIHDTLIRRNEVDINMEDEKFLKQLIIIAKTRGLKKTEEQVFKQMRQNSKVQNAYEIDKYIELPLLDPQAVTCYYFRNKSGVYFGELEPYFAMEKDEILADNTDYWNGLKFLLPNFYITDVESSNHLVLLSEQEACKTVIDFCELLYSKKTIGGM